MSTITIPVTEYIKLKQRDNKLRLLENGGVDNWEWYGDSLHNTESEKPYDEQCEEIEQQIMEQIKL